jgi:hypothetical protein
MKNKKLIVIAAALNVRSIPSTQGAIVDVLNKDEVVDWLETKTDGKWYKIQKGTLIGWSSASYLQFTKNEQLEKIIQLASTSKISQYDWDDRGVAPRGYIKGMALVYGRVYCKLKAGDAAALEMAKTNTGNSSKDALAHYAQEFQNAGMDIDSAGVDTLRHLFVLLIGLGMRESSGDHCVGRDGSADNTTAETAEAGLFQTSYNARSASPLLPKLFQQYLTNPLGFVEIFKEGVTCSDKDWENFGDGEGEEFQRLSKSCPAFAAEFAAVGLRNIRKHWGPINRKEVEIRPECDSLLIQVQNIIDQDGFCSLLL